MTPAERISRLEGLLERIRVNAAQPRPVREPASQPISVDVDLGAAASSGTIDFDSEVVESVPPSSAGVHDRPTMEPPTSPPESLGLNYEEEPTLVRRLPQDMAAFAPESADEPTSGDDDEIDVDDSDLLGDIDVSHELEAAERERAEREAAARRAEEERLAAEELAEAERFERELEEAEREREARLAAERAAAEQAEKERIAAEQREAERLEAERVAAELRAAAEARAAAEQAQRERIAAEQRAAAERAEQERIAAEQRAAAERAKQERIAEQRAAAERAEQERIAAEQRAAAERAEQERIAAEQRAAAERAEQERIAAEQRAAAERAEQERIAAEQRAAAERAEQERIAAEQRAAAERAEQERIAAEQRADAERAALAASEARSTEPQLPTVHLELPPSTDVNGVEAPSPISSRQPKQEGYGEVLDDAFAELEDEEQPPESGEVASQRKPSVHEEPTLMAALGEWDEQEAAVKLVAEPAPADAGTAAAGQIPAIEVTADIVRRPMPRAEAAAFLGAVRAPRPATFGELLDQSLQLGSD